MPNTTANYAFYKPLVNDPVDQDLWGGYWNTNADTFDSALNTRLFDYNFVDFKLIRPEMKDYAETVATVVAASTTTIDIQDGNVVNMSQDTNITTFTWSNPSATGKACSFTLVRTKDATATARTIAWPASVKWSGGSAPSITQTTGAVDIFTFFTLNAGTAWYGSDLLDVR